MSSFAVKLAVGGRRALTLGALIVLPVSAIPTPVAARSAATTLPAVADAKQATQICVSIKAALAKLPSQAAVEDIEAAIVFVLSQASYAPATMAAGLSCASEGADGNARTAFANVRASYGRSGTGATRPSFGSSNGGGGVFFSPPVVGVGGGTTNYTSSR